MINADDENPFKGLAEGLDILLTFDDVVVEHRPEIIENDPCSYTCSKGFPDRKITVELMISVYVVPRSAPIVCFD